MTLVMLKAVKETSDVQAIESYSSEDFDKALERTIDFLTFNKIYLVHLMLLF